MGGKVFKAEDGALLAKRIPTGLIQELYKAVESDIGHFFDHFQLTSNILSNDQKSDHGDLDILCLPIKSKYNIREELRKMFLARYTLTSANGNFEHILYPFRGYHYQIDLILCSSEQDFKRVKFFYSRPIVFNAIVGHFARSCGYKFSTHGFFLRIVDLRERTHFFELSGDPKTGLSLLGLEWPMKDINLYQNPQDFANWILSSIRFHGIAFQQSENQQSHRDAKKDLFCNQVYKLLEQAATDLIQKQAAPEFLPTIINLFQNKVNLNTALEFEKRILGDVVVEEIRQFIEKKSEVVRPDNQIINGYFLISMGYEPGALIGQILNSVNRNPDFNKDTSPVIIKLYIQKNFPINFDCPKKKI